jgi:hypothetical protein
MQRRQVHPQMMSGKRHAVPLRQLNDSHRGRCTLSAQGVRKPRANRQAEVAARWQLGNTKDVCFSGELELSVYIAA